MKRITLILLAALTLALFSCKTTDASSPQEQFKKLKVSQILFTNLVTQLNVHKAEFADKDLKNMKILVKVTAANLTLWKESIIFGAPRLDLNKVIDKNLTLLTEILAKQQEND